MLGPVLERLQNVSTHSRPKAAGQGAEIHVLLIDVSTHSRPKAAGDYINPSTQYN